MTLSSTLGRAIELLDGCGIAHMIAGSVAGIQYSFARTTQDIDIVVQLDEESLRCLLGAAEEAGFYVPAQTALDALDRRDQFNLLDMRLGWKVELIIQKDRPFSRIEFDRRQRAVIDGVEVHIASVEDIILSKLEWAQAGESDRQLRDVSNILETSDGLIDWSYVERWARDLDVTALLASLRTQP